MELTKNNIDLSSMTPMLRQYFELKNSCTDCVLFFRMGDFYEVFGEDAVKVSGLLNIVLTKREKGEDSIPFCGVPHHSAKNYWLKLLKLNFKVAIADQVEEASLAKGLVRREITKFLTPGCIDEIEGLQSDQSNYLMFVYEDPDAKIWIAGITDISTGELRLAEADSVEAVIKVVETYKPKEVLLRRFLTPVFKDKLSGYLSQEPLLFTPMPEAILRDKSSQETLLKKIFGHLDFINFPFENKSAGSSALAALFTHLHEMKFSLHHFMSVFPLVEGDRFTLASTAINDLELFDTMRQRQQKGSLYNEINYCLTPMGSRFLRWSLKHLFLKKELIEKSHNWVQELIQFGEKTISDLRLLLDGVSDLERLLTKVLSKSIKPKELGCIRESLKNISKLVSLIEVRHPSFSDPSLKSCLMSLGNAESVCQYIDSFLLENPEHLGDGDGVFISGLDKILDEKNGLSKNGEIKVQEYQDHLKKITGIASLKIKTHKNFGLLIEVTKTHLNKIPDNFIRKQTMVNCERFLTVELQELSDALASAKEDAIERELCLYDKYISELAEYSGCLKKISTELAELDVKMSFAWIAIQKKYCRVELTQDLIELRAVRHPTVENFVGTHVFNPNDLLLNASSKQVLITGPNMGGKSTIMRTVALCAILNQCGGFIPASSGKLPIFDQIFTRVGASDDLVKGLSTFMVEMSETAYILRHSTSKSLVILDEVGRGTSTEDGLAIASAIFEDFSTRIKAWTLFATHYHELVEFAQNLKNIKTYQMEVLKTSDSIKFSHRLIEGSSGSSYGVDVARLAGVPVKVIERARALLTRRGINTSKNVVQLDNPVEQNGETVKFMMNILDEVNLNKTTPLQAFNILLRLKDAESNKSTKTVVHDRQPLF